MTIFSPTEGIARGYIHPNAGDEDWPSRYVGQFDDSGWDGLIPQNFDPAAGPIVVWMPGPYERFRHPVDGWKESQHTAMSAIVHHGMAGHFRTTESWFVPEFRNPDRLTLWHFSVRNDKSLYNPHGRAIIYQHAPAFARTIASSGANFAGPAIELEGVDEPITERQIAAVLHIHKQLSPHMSSDFKYERNADAKTGDVPIWGLVEHGQFPTKFGSTACPVGRYDRLWQRLGTLSEDNPDLTSTATAAAVNTRVSSVPVEVDVPIPDQVDVRDLVAIEVDNLIADMYPQIDQMDEGMRLYKREHDALLTRFDGLVERVTMLEDTMLRLSKALQVD